MILWNLIHGCHRKSEGCKNCYVFARDEQHGIDTNIVRKTSSFDLPLRRNRNKEWKIPSGSLVMTCFSSDFFIEEMDQWRSEAWGMRKFYQRQQNIQTFTSCSNGASKKGKYRFTAK